MNLFRSKPYRARFQFYECVICGAPSSEAAHVRIGWTGMGLQKPSDSCCVPLCTWCHRTGPEAQHKSNETEWWAARGIDPLALAKRLHEIWAADPKDAQGIHEAIGMAHQAIEEFAWRAFKHAIEDFKDSPSHERADKALRTYKVHLISMGGVERYEAVVADLSEQLNTILIKSEAA